MLVNSTTKKFVHSYWLLKGMEYSNQMKMQKKWNRHIDKEVPFFIFSPEGVNSNSKSFELAKKS